eukprot:356917-Chlamydomonas_euryale.AAC.2
MSGGSDAVGARGASESCRWRGRQSERGKHTGEEIDGKISREVKDQRVEQVRPCLYLCFLPQDFGHPSRLPRRPLRRRARLKRPSHIPVATTTVVQLQPAGGARLSQRSSMLSVAGLQPPALAILLNVPIT